MENHEGMIWTHFDPCALTYYWCPILGRYANLDEATLSAGLVASYPMTQRNSGVDETPRFLALCW